MHMFEHVSFSPPEDKIVLQGAKLISLQTQASAVATPERLEIASLNHVDRRVLFETPETVLDRTKLALETDHS